MRRKNPISVPLHNGVPRLERFTNPEGTSLATASERREGQVKGIVARYNVLKDKFELPYRKNLVAAQTVELGQQIAAGQVAAQRAKTEKAQRSAANHTKARKLGVPSELVGDDEDSREALALLESSRRQHLSEQSPQECEEESPQ